MSDECPEDPRDQNADWSDERIRAMIARHFDAYTADIREAVATLLREEILPQLITAITDTVRERLDTARWEGQDRDARTPFDPHGET
jgi:hypothetical protein